MSKISQYTALGSVQSDDLLVVVDVHDTSQASSGTTKKITVSQLPGGGIAPPAGDIGGTAGSPTVVSTHLSAALPVAQGGTGQATQQAALDALAGAVTSGQVLRGNGTHVALAAIQAADVPTLNQNTTGTAAGLSATLAVGSGGTGSATRNFAGLLTPTGVKTTTYAAAAGDFVPCDTTSGGFTVTLPNAPADLTVVGVKQVIQGGTNTVTVACAGSDVFNKAGGGTTGTLTLLAQGMLLQYKASGGIWYVLADDLPLTQLDTRYVKAGPVTFTYGSTGAVPAAGTWTAGAVVVDQNGIVRVCTVGGSPGTWARDGALPSQFWVEDYGALGNGKIVGDAAMTSSTATLTSATAGFISGDAGKNIIVNGALGASNAPLYTTILSVTNSTTVVLNANATNTVTNAAAFWASDDSAAIVSCIAAASTYAQANNWKAQVLFRARSYGLATLTTTAASGSLAQQNALVPIPYPNVNGTTQKLIFELVGVGEAADEQYFGSTIPSVTGTALVATVAASGTNPSIVGGPNASTNLTGTWANTKLIARGVTVWAGFNPGWVGWDLRQCSAVWIDDAGAQVLAPAGGGQNPGLVTIPTNTSGWGFILPANNDNGAGRLMVEGYYQGVGVSPRTTIEKLFTQSNAIAVFARTVNATVTHGVRIGYWSCNVCTTAIGSTGTSGTMPLIIDMFDSAGAITTDLSDAHGTLPGSMNWWHTTSTGPTVAAGFAMRIVNLRLNPGPVSSPPSAPSSGSPSTAIFRDTEVTLSLSGGTMTALTIGGVDQHIPASCVLWKITVPSGYTYTPTYTGALTTDVTVL